MKKIISFLIFLLFAWLAMWWYYSCDWCARETGQNQKNEEKIKLEREAAAKKAYEDSIAAIEQQKLNFVIKDDDNRDALTLKGQLQINDKNGDVFIPDAVADIGDLVADYLGKNQNKELLITGYETSEEKNTGDELGLARATFMKDLFIKSGINSGRISTSSEIKDYEYDADGNHVGGISLLFKTLTEERTVEVEKSVANRTLYSNFGEKTFKPDATLSNYALELKNYLNKYPNKSVRVIGHTDDVGDEEANLWFGQQRANNVRQYLISRGIDADKVKATSKGESNPIVPNTSEENRAKNRRIEIIVN